MSATPSLKKVVVIGRPNVGKSTLFNRLVGQRKALVHDEPGVTRDRIEKKTQWWFHGHSFPFLIVDTGGLGGDRFSDEIAKQVRIALTEADVAILVMDGQAGLTPADRQLIRELKQQGLEERMPLFTVINKVDIEAHETFSSEFFETQLEPMLTISAEHNRGIDDLKLAIAERLGLLADLAPKMDSTDSAEFDDVSALEEEDPASTFEEKIPRIAVVGRPNVGKSTFVNAILSQDRMITSPIAGTTVDAVDSLTELDGKPYIFIDTAGIRRKSKTEQGVEVLSVVQARKALEHADLAILVLDGEQGISDQDEKIGGLIEEAGTAVILAVNKWDTQKGNRDFSRDQAAELVRGKMAYLKYAPIVFMSAKRKQGLDSLPGLIDEILHQRKLKIPTHEFTQWVRKEATIHNPLEARFYLCHQSGRHPPTFVCHVNDPKKIHFSLQRHLVNAMRERWGYMGNPVRLNFVKGQNRPKSQSFRKSTKSSPSTR